MQAGEVYATKQTDAIEAASTVVVTLDAQDEDYETVPCLVIVDDGSLSMYGPGTVDSWQARQLHEHFTRVG
jgi:hypothetical protein